MFHFERPPSPHMRAHASLPWPDVRYTGGMASEEVFMGLGVPRERVPVCTEIRSTLIGSSILALKRHQLFDRYLANLPRQHHDAILYAVAGQWLPIELGMVHYDACAAMGLPTDEIVAIGASVASLAQKAMFSFVLRMATESGVTPWSMIAKGQAYWARSYRGSNVAAYKLGPKECRVETVANPLAQNPYWRSSFRGIVTALTQAFCTRAFVHERPWRREDPFVAHYRISWV
jgi:hypothetical protein